MAAALAAWLVVACEVRAHQTDAAPDAARLPKDLLDPQFCAACHPKHYQEWSGSMHAYASTDPVFIALNARGQRETDGELGSFCVQCHAPIALATNQTIDGLNLPELERSYQGVTCTFCHSVVAIEGTHNNPLRIELNGIFRAGIDDPIEAGAHVSVASSIHRASSPDSAALCGSCHDVVVGGTHALERTFLEWKETLYGEQSTCGNCHMPGYDGLAANVEGAPIRRIHSHAMPAVDTALVAFPEREGQRLGVVASLNPTVAAELCVRPTRAGTTRVTVTLRNRIAGHSFPSGAAQDRRAWVELIASEDGQVRFSTGVVDQGTALGQLTDANLWWFGDEIYDKNGEPTLMFWEATTHTSQTLAGPQSADPDDEQFSATQQSRVFEIPGNPDHVSMRLLLRPIRLELIDSLIDSGDLDPGLKSALPTYSLANTELTWGAGDGECVSSRLP